MKVSSKNDVCELYEETAGDYSEMMDTEIKLPVYEVKLGQLAKRISNLSGAVIDTSCGSGHMLSMYHKTFDSQRELIGIDLSPKMVEISSGRLAEAADILTGDMCKLAQVKSNFGAAVINYFAIHHLDPAEVLIAIREWCRILKTGGQLIIAIWEGTGLIDYHGETDILANRYTQSEISGIVQKAGFTVNQCVVESITDFPMDAIYLEATKN